MKYDLLFCGDTFLMAKDSVEGGFFSLSAEAVFANSLNACINLETTIGVGGTKKTKSIHLPDFTGKCFIFNKE